MTPAASADARTRLWECGVILGVGAIVSAAPAVWYPLVWEGSSSWLDDWVGFTFSMLPFLLAALLRAIGALSRIGGGLALAVSVPFVVFGQVSGLNPNDTSSTASIAIAVAPMWATGGVVLIWWADRIVIVATRAWRSTRRPSGP
jgi:hypothetical protein